MFNSQSLMAPRDMQERYATFSVLRQNMPVLPIPNTDLWFIFRYEDIRRIISDPDTFSSDFKHFGKARLEANPDAALALQSIVGIDPPIHRKMRDLISRAFTPRIIEQYEGKIRTLVDGLLDKVIESGNFDVIRDVSEPLPTKVIAGMLGVAPEVEDDFRKSSDILLQADVSANEVPLEVTQAERALHGYFQDLIEARRTHPQDDLTSALVMAEIDGERLSERDISAFCELLLIAGNGTTTHLIGNMMLALMQNPTEFARLRENPTLLTSAIEETLRYYSPAQTVLRSAVKDVTVGGQAIPAGSRIFPMLASANRDEAKFIDADRFDITRQPNQHIAFGNGIHFCIGAPLARLETRVTFEAILKRLHQIELDPSATLAVNPGLLINSLKALPLHFTAAERMTAQA